MDGDGGKDGEEHGVAGNLKAEVDDFWQSSELDCGGPMAGKPGHLDVY